MYISEFFGYPASSIGRHVDFQGAWFICKGSLSDEKYGSSERADSGSKSRTLKKGRQ